MASPIKNKQILVSSDFDANNHKLINVIDPINNQDGSTKAYTDSGDTSLSTAISSETSSRTSTDTSLSTAILDPWIDINRCGFVDNTQTDLIFNSSTHVLTLSGLTIWEYYRVGIRYAITGNKTITLPAPSSATTMYYITINSSDGTLISGTTQWTLLDSTLPVATVLMNSGTTPTCLVSDERHTILIDRRMHAYLHLTRGVQFISGGILTGLTLATASDVATTFGVSQTVIADEDLFETLPAIPKYSGTTLDYNIFYRTSTTTWSWKLSEVPFSYTAGSYIDYDNNGTLTTGAAIKWYNSYLLFIDHEDKTGSTMVMGRSVFNSLVLAQAESPLTFDWTGFPIAEAIIAYQFTWTTNNSYTNKGKVVLAATPKKINISTVSTVGSGAGTDHNTLAGLQGGITSEYYHLTSADYITATGISTTISTEILTRISVDSSLTTSISNETSTRTSAVTSLTTQVSSEISRSVSLTTAISSETSTRTSADISLSTNLSSEISIRASVVTSLTTQVSSEISRSVSLTTAISNETSTRTSADASLSTSLSSEISATNSDVTSLSTATSMRQKYTSAGVYAYPTITDNLNGSITVGTGEYTVYANSGYSYELEKYIHTGGTFTLTDNSVNYLTLENISGVPTMYMQTNRNNIHQDNVIPISTIYREGTILHIIDWDTMGKGLSNKLSDRMIRTERFAIETGGFVLSESPVRYVVIANGVVWYGGARVIIDAVNSSTDSAYLWYHNGGNWTKSATTQYNNTYYDNGTNLVTLGNGRYAVNWIYRSIENAKIINIVLGEGDYKIGEAQSSILPDVPSIITTTSLLVGRIIVVYSGTTAYEIDSAFATVFATTPLSDHALLTNLDYANSGHIGFAAETGMTSLSTIISTNISRVNSLSTAISVGDSSLSSVISTEVSTRTSANTSITTQISSEISRSVSLTTIISSEASIRTVADTSLSTAVSSEVSRNTILSTNLSSEILSRISGDSSLSTAISVGDSSLTAAINFGVSGSTSGVTSLSTALSIEISVTNYEITSLSTVLSSVDDITPNLEANDLLYYNGITISGTTNLFPSLSTAISSNIQSLSTAISNGSGVSTLSQLTDVSLSTPLSDGQILTYSGSTWTNKIGGNSDILSISTVVSTEISDRTFADTSLATQVSSEISRSTSLTTILSSEISSTNSDVTSLSTGVSTKISSEISSRTSGDASLTTAISSEKSTTNYDVTSISLRLSSEISSRTSGDASLTTAISSEKSTTNSDVTSLSTAVSTRISVDTSLTSILSSEISSTNSDITSLSAAFDSIDFTSLSTQVSSEISRSTSLTSILSSEISSRTSGDASLTTKIYSEISATNSDVTSISSRLSSEISSRTSGDASLTTAISNEISSENSTDTSLSTRISSEISSRTSGDASLTSHILNLTLNNLADVTIATPAVGQTLTYNASSQWVNTTQINLATQAANGQIIYVTGGTVSGGTEIYTDGTNIITSGAIRTGGGTAAAPSFSFFGDTNCGFFRDYADSIGVATAGVEYFRFASGGVFHADSDIIAYSTSVSDIRLKENINTLETPLEKILRLNGVNFTYKNKNDGVHNGFIAQEVEKIIPNVVIERELPLMTNNDGQKYKVVRYEEIIPYITEAIKEQQNIINDLQKTVLSLKKDIVDLKNLNI